jgi:hypothetical protein
LGLQIGTFWNGSPVHKSGPWGFSQSAQASVFSAISNASPLQEPQVSKDGLDFIASLGWRKWLAATLSLPARHKCE